MIFLSLVFTFALLLLAFLSQAEKRESGMSVVSFLIPILSIIAVPSSLAMIFEAADVFDVILPLVSLTLAFYLTPIAILDAWDKTPFYNRR